jgi:hypothetical protein
MKNSIPWEHLRDFAKAHDCTHAILLAHDGKQDWVVTWGNTVVDAQRSADFGNELKRELKWPESLMARPDRITDLIAVAEKAYACLTGQSDDNPHLKLLTAIQKAKEAK